RGTITDSTGAVLPSAQLVLTNTDQNRPYRTTSNDAGEYFFVQIPPGPYKMTVEARGFKKFQRDEFTLEVAQVLGLDVQMQVGSTNEVIEVTGEAPILEAESSALGEVVNSRTAEALPLNGRNVTQLIALTPGINTSPGFRNTMDSN